MRADFMVPAGLRVDIADTCNWKANDLPYYEPNSAATLPTPGLERARRTWHFGAWLDGKIVGHAILFVNTGESGEWRHL